MHIDRLNDIEQRRVGSRR